MLDDSKYSANNFFRNSFPFFLQFFYRVHFEENLIKKNLESMSPSNIIQDIFENEQVEFVHPIVKKKRYFW